MIHQAKAVFTLYRIDFRSGSEIKHPYNVNSAQGNRTGPDWSGVELFTPYQIDMLHICFGLAKATQSRVQDNDKEVPFRKQGLSAEQPVDIRRGAFQKAFRYRTYHFWNRSAPGHNRHKNRDGSVGSVWIEGLSGMVFGCSNNRYGIVWTWPKNDKDLKQHDAIMKTYQVISSRKWNKLTDNQI